MRGTGSTVRRQWEILRLLPRHLYAISTTDIHDKLRSIGYEVSKRTIERDLASLEQQFPLRCEERGRTHLWSWHKDAQVAQVPGMASTEALTLLLAGDYLRDLLPDGVITDVEPYLKRAESTIAGTKLRDWRSKVRRLGGSPTLIPPDVAPE